jgi:nitroreductase
VDLHEALYTTRAMRRLRPDAIPQAVQARILDAAIRAPTGGNAQGWRFLLVDDPEVRQPLAELYRTCAQMLWENIYADRIAAARANPEAPESVEFDKLFRSADHLARHFEDVPLLLFAFVQSDPTGSSIFPAVWSAMLAARAEGVGSTLTSLFQFRLEELLRILSVPSEGRWNFACCVTFGYPTGRWGIAPRRPAHEVSYRNRWGEALEFSVPEPLWAGP